MSCGKPHETDCAEVLAEVWLFLDHECDTARRKLLERHQDECQPCLAEYGLDEKLKKLLATKCAGDSAPAELKARLRASIRKTVLEQAEVTVETGPTGTVVEVRATRIERTHRSWTGARGGPPSSGSGVRPLAVVRAALLAVAALACPTGHRLLLTQSGS